MTEITTQTLTTLAEKISTLDLADAEQAVLDRILDRAGAFEDETVGFVASEDELMGVASEDELLGFKGGHAGLPGLRGVLAPMALKLGKGAGLWG